MRGRDNTPVHQSNADVLPILNLLRQKSLENAIGERPPETAKPHGLSHSMRFAVVAAATISAKACAVVAVFSCSCQQTCFVLFDDFRRPFGKQGRLKEIFIARATCCRRAPTAHARLQDPKNGLRKHAEALYCSPSFPKNRHHIFPSGLSSSRRLNKKASLPLITSSSRRS